MVRHGVRILKIETTAILFAQRRARQLEQRSAAPLQ
jgi:hypothetical protein